MTKEEMEQLKKRVVDRLENTKPICPKCGKGITYLHCYSETRQTFEIDDNKQPNYSSIEEVMDSGQYECPNCCEELFDNEEDAKEFLSRGK